MAMQASRPRLLGREAETRALGDALDRVASGRLAVVLVEGEAGIGKTRLLGAALADARGRGMQVAAGQAEELEQSRPFGLVADAFGCVRSSPDPQPAAIAGLLMGGGTERDPITVTSDPGLRFRAVDAFADLAEELALAGPLVIGVDDLQWADPSSLLTLATICRRLAYLPVALIGCLRPSPRGRELTRLADALEAAGGQRLTLRGLGEHAVTELVAEAVAAQPGPNLMAEISGAAGNPLFVTELIAALIQEGAISIADGQAEVAATALPPTLRLTILRRLSFLSEDTLHTLRAASILGASFSPNDLATVTGRSALELSVVLGNAIRASVLEEDGTHLRFRHSLIRDAIYEDLPLSVRRGLHREAGKRLAQAAAPARQVVEHLTRGAHSADAETIQWLTKAAREAAPTSPDVAADMLERASGLMRPGDPEHDRLLAERAACLRLSGRLVEAADACRLLLRRHLDPSVECSLRIGLGHALLAQGQARDALRELEQAQESPALDKSDRAAAQAWVSYARLALGDLDGAAAAAEEARIAAVSAGDHLSVSVAMRSLTFVAEFRGHFAEALRIVDDAVRIADRSPDRMGHRYPLHAVRGRLLIEYDRSDAARAALDTGRRISEELGERWAVLTYQVFQGFERFVAGEWDDAIAELETGFDLAEELGDTYRRMYGGGMLSLIKFHRNDLNGARLAAQIADQDPAGLGPGYRMTLASLPTALILEADGEPARALEVLAGAWDRCVSSGIVVECPAIGADLVRLALTARDVRLAQDVAATVDALASGNDVPWITGSALHCRGLLDDDAPTMEAAGDAYSRGSRRLEAALAYEHAGTAYARLGQVEQAPPLLDRAISIYEQLGAARDSARVDAVLRGIGIRRGRRGPRDRPQLGWQSLTPAERKITYLVAEGLSNPQIGDRLYISRRTVQAHLAHVFAKLDISSRAQLAAEVTQHRHRSPVS